MHLRTLFLTSLLSFGFCQTALSQQQNRILDHNFNGWYMYFGDHPIGQGPWGIHIEGQWRRHNFITDNQQLMVRPGVNYQVNPNLMLTAGYLFVKTYRYGDFPVAAAFPEHRIFQQAVVKHSIGRVGLSHRYRLEQRFLGEVSVQGGRDPEVQRWRHENRFRYQFRSTIPFRGSSIDQGSLYAALYNEFFVNFGQNVAANVFDQNRAYAAAGYAVTKDTRVEAGYLNQIIQQRNGRIFEVNHTFQLAVFSTIPFGRN